jgi:hypothetical protein
VPGFESLPAGISPGEPDLGFKIKPIHFGGPRAVPEADADRLPGGDLPVHVRPLGQNRQAALQQVKADHDFVEEEQELRTNTDLTRAIHTLTTDIHRRLLDGGRPGPGPALEATGVPSSQLTQARDAGGEQDSSRPSGSGGPDRPAAGSDGGMS